MKIELTNIIEAYGLDRKKLAEVLFSGNTHQKAALRRIESSEGLLDSDQVLLLARYIGVSVDELYSFKNWTISKFKKGVITFKKAAFEVILNCETWKTSIYKDGKLQTDELLIQESILLSDYITYLNQLTDEN